MNTKRHLIGDQEVNRRDDTQKDSEKTQRKKRHMKCTARTAMNIITVKKR